MFKLFAVLFLVLSASTSFAQQPFIGPTDSLRYRIESKVATSGYDPKTKMDARVDALSSFTVAFSRSRIERDTLFVSTYFHNVRTEVDMPDSAPASAKIKDTVINGWDYEGIEFRGAFRTDGQLIAITPLDEEDLVMAGAVGKFSDLLKIAFFRYDAAGLNTPGKHVKTMQKDTTEIYGMQVITWSYYDHAWRGVIDTLGGKYAVVNFVVDSTQLSGNSFLASSGIGLSPGGTFGTVAYFPGTTKPYLLEGASKIEMDLSGMLPKDKASKDKPASASKKIGVMTMDMRIRAQLLQ